MRVAPRPAAVNGRCGVGQRLLAQWAPAGAGKPTERHIKAEIYVKGSVEKAVVKTRGAIEASLHRWPAMEDWA